MNYISQGKIRFLVLATFLGLTTLASAATPSPKPTSAPIPEGFEVESANGASLVAPLKEYKALSSDKSFHGVLSRWSIEAGWHLSWELDSEYTFSFEAAFGNDFIKAVDAVCANLATTGVSAKALVYENNKVIRIVAEGTKP